VDFSFRSTTELILQPHGAFIVDRSLNRFNVLNRAGAGIALGFIDPAPLDSALATGRAAGLSEDGVEAFVADLQAKGYLSDQPRGRASLPLLEARRVLKATRAEVEITNRCNLRCVYCYAEVNRSRDELSAMEWIDILSSMYGHGLRSVLFSGGEPFFHKGFLDVLEWAFPRLVVEINTNGTYVTDEIAAALGTMDLKQVQVSIDSRDPGYHDSVRGRGSHARAVQAIERLVAAGVPVQVSAVITAANKAAIADLKSYATELGARFKAEPITRTGFARDIDDSTWEEAFAASSGDRVTATSSTSPLPGFEPVCQSQVGYVAVSHQGILKPCNMREHFFEPTGSVLLEQRAARWWERFYGDTQLAGLAASATAVDDVRAEELRAEAGGYLCGLQLGVAAQGLGGVGQRVAITSKPDH